MALSIHAAGGKLVAAARGFVRAFAVMAALTAGSAPAALAAGEPLPVRVEVSPALANLAPGQRQIFEAKAYDASGAEIPFAARWRTEPGAQIDGSGVFQSEKPGRYTVSAGDEAGRVLGAAVAIVQAPRARLGELVLRPKETRLLPGDKAQFRALLLDRDGNAREAQLLWQARGGRIDQTGLYTAGVNPGRFRITVLDRHSGLQASAVVQILAAR